MTTKRKGTTRILLPDGPVDAEYDDDDVVDLETEVVLDSQGRRIDQAWIDEAVEAAHAYIDAHPEIVPAPGRPSLSRGRGQPSPQVTLRVPPRMAAELDRLSAQRGVSRSTLVREALTEYLRRAS